MLRMFDLFSSNTVGSLSQGTEGKAKRSNELGLTLFNQTLNINGNNNNNNFNIYRNFKMNMSTLCL